MMQKIFINKFKEQIKSMSTFQKNQWPLDGNIYIFESDLTLR
jgi:hypothetical protein